MNTFAKQKDMLQKIVKVSRETAVEMKDLINNCLKNLESEDDNVVLYAAVEINKISEYVRRRWNKESKKSFQELSGHER